MKTGVIGSGCISEIYLENMIHKFNQLEVVAVADLRLENARKRAEQFGIAYCSVDDLLQNKDIELVVVLTPVQTHYEVIKQALEAGKHIYTEKTISDNSKNARELLELADKKGLYLGSAPDTFLGSAIQTAKMAIDDGLLGEIHSFSISVNRNNDLLLACFPILRTPGTGVLFDYGVYHLTALVSILGPVSRVGGIVGAPYKTRMNKLPFSPDYGQTIECPNESEVSAVLQLKNGITGTLHIDNESHTIDQAYFAIYGTKGILYLSDANQFGGEIRFLPNTLDYKAKVEPVTLLNFTPYGDNARGIGPAEMADAIKTGRKNRASKEMAFHVLQVLEAILEGGIDGKFITIDSDFTLPSALKQKTVPITNIGHITFRMKNEKEMLHFYEDILGMKKLFLLTSDDLLATARKDNDSELTELLSKRFPDVGSHPWIQYMKLADHQYLELLFQMGEERQEVKNPEDYYGFKKVNYEVHDIYAMYHRLTEKGIKVKDKIHTVADGAKEFTVLDPDGNKIQFTEYGDHSVLPLSKLPFAEQISPLNYTTQVALQVRDEINMQNFYCKGLGLKKAYTLTCGTFATFLEKQPDIDEEFLTMLKINSVKSFIDYIEVGPHQYIELFHNFGSEKKKLTDLSNYYGYQHLCLEVSDIHEAWDAVLSNGITPKTEIALGIEGAYQFWITDPDGNELELMQYTANSKQLL